MSGIPALGRRLALGAARFAADARDLVFPPHCPACGGLRQGGGDLCPACSRDLPVAQRDVCGGCGTSSCAAVAAFCPACRERFAADAVVFAAPYAGSAKGLVHRFKYRADLEAGRVLGGLLAGCVAAAGWAGPVDLVAPVPLHRWRLGRRGFNQAALLARDLGRRCGLPVDVAALARVRRTRSLAGLSPLQRAEELSGAFAVRRPQRVAGRRVLVVDDVMTTGATVEGCCRALKAAGAVWTGVAVAARVLLPLASRERPKAAGS